MSTQVRADTRLLTPFEQLRYAREIVRTEARTLDQLAGRLGDSFCQAVDLVFRGRGSVIVTGMGKAGLVGRKISATLSSTGTRSHYLHPGEAFHGDLGRVHEDDIVMALSQSGETEEVTRLLPSLFEMGVPIIALTGAAASTLGRTATVTIELGAVQEACSLGLAPTTSTTALLALGDALALVVSRMRNFRAEDFARFHPGGSLGRRLSKVADHMRPLDQCRLAPLDHTVRQVVVECTKPGRRTGAIMLVDEQERLRGLFTDSDLARLFEKHKESALDRSISEVMTSSPRTVPPGAMLRDAHQIMAERKISELPVVDGDGRPLGLIDITDMVGLLPAADEANERPRGDAAHPKAVRIDPKSITNTPHITVFPSTTADEE